MNKTPPLLRSALLATVLLLFFLAGDKASAVEALLLQDTYVDGGNPTTNYGNSEDLQVGGGGLIIIGGGRGSSSSRAFLKFSMATLPPGTTAADIKQAQLRLWLGSRSQPCSTCAQGVGGPPLIGWIYLTPVTSEWGELDLTDDTSGALTFGPEQTAAMLSGSVGNFASIDITDWVQAWLSGTLVNEGFSIEAGDGNFLFDSKESQMTSHEPQLDIVLVGPAGPQGPAGAAGPQGLQGLTGATGATGPQGAVGPIGPQGNTGATGAVGATGSTGATGPIGLTGPAGPAGQTGAPGETGPQGAQGSAVLSGTELPPDDLSTGRDGDFYINTENGNIYGPKTKGAWGDPIGTLYGRNGSEWHWGDGIPNPALGVYGDFYLDRTTGDVFNRWGEDGAWYNIGNIRGPQGLVGATGSAGAQGPPGVAGVQGPAGPSGLDGPAGPQGPIGPAGSQGLTGPAGSQGPTGPAGDLGPSGPTGPQGPVGITPTHIQPQGDLSMGDFTQGEAP